MAEKKEYRITRMSDGVQYRCRRVSNIIKAGLEDGYKTEVLNKWAVGCMADKIIAAIVELKAQLLADTEKESEEAQSIENILKRLPTDIEEAKSAYIEKREAAANIGSRVHAMIATHIEKGQTPNLEQLERAERNCFTAFLNWEKANCPKWIASECVVCDFDEGFPVAGRLDAVAYFKAGKHKGKYCLLDFKTSTAIRKEYVYQLGAYWWMLKANKEEFVHHHESGYEEKFPPLNIRLHMGMILRLDKETGDYHDKALTDREMFHHKRIFREHCKLQKKMKAAHECVKLLRKKQRQKETSLRSKAAAKKMAEVV